MKKLLIKILDFCFDYSNLKVADSVITTATAIVVETYVSAISKEWLRTQIAIRARVQLTEHQLNLVIKMLPYQLLRHRIAIKVTHLQVWVMRTEMSVTV